MSGILNLPGLRELDKKESETEYHVKAEPAAFDDDFEVKTKTRMANVGTDLPTLLAILDTDGF